MFWTTSNENGTGWRFTVYLRREDGSVKPQITSPEYPTREMAQEKAREFWPHADPEEGG